MSILGHRVIYNEYKTKNYIIIVALPVKRSTKFPRTVLSSAAGGFFHTLKNYTAHLLYIYTFFHIVYMVEY